MDKQKLLTLLTKYENDECTEEEVSLLKEWFKNFPAIDDNADLFENEPEENVRERIWEGVSGGLKRRAPSITRFSAWYKVAAAIAVFLLIGIYWTELKKGRYDEKNYETIVHSRDRDTTFYLPDSSKLVLKPNSSVRFSDNFLTNRAVILDGGCLFDVKKKLETPFQVVSREQTTTVTGTIFTIEAYPDDNQVTTHLLEGSVRVTLAQGTKEIDMIPNEVVVYAVDAGTLTKLDKTEDLSGAVSLTANPQLLFEATSYDELFTRLEARFGVTIFADQEKLKSCYFSANFQAETLEEILTILASVNHFKYQIVGTIVYIDDFEC